jgi:ABC-2 type transport system permease protein
VVRIRNTERLSLLQAALVIARRDFLAVLLSRTFLFFLLGPLFPVLVGGLAGGVGSQVRQSVEAPVLGIMLPANDALRVVAAHHQLQRSLNLDLPEIRQLDPDAGAPSVVLRNGSGNLAAVLSGTLAAPVLTGSAGQNAAWEGDVRLMLAEARSDRALTPPRLTLQEASSSSADALRGRLTTAQGAQLLLFLLSMLLAGMVLSNLVEEKGNKIIEILAAAIPMDAVFLGKLFAMLAISFVGITVWGTSAAAILLLARDALPPFPVPAVGWPGFVALFVIYFAMNYLLLGAIFLAIGSLAATVREVQTLSMPVTMSQVLIFFLANLAVAQPGSKVAWAAAIFPLSSPYAMLAHAALEPGWTVHLIGLAWQVLFVALFIKAGAALFRRRVMQSGSGPRRSLRERLRSRPV